MISLVYEGRLKSFKPQHEAGITCQNHYYNRTWFARYL